MENLQIKRNTKKQPTNFMQKNAEALTEYDNLILNKRNKKNETHCIPKSFAGLSKHVLVQKFANILKSQLKLHALDEKQFKFVNDLSFDKSSENALKRELLKRKLLKEITDTFLNNKKTKKKFYEIWRFKFIRIFKTLALKISFLIKPEYFNKIFRPLKFMVKVHLPDEAFRISFDTLCLIFIVWEVIMIPLFISFPDLNGVESLQFFESIITIFFLIDIVLNFQTGFYQRGSLVTKRKEIVKHYLKSWLVFDLLGSFPYDWLVDQNDESSGLSQNSSAIFQMMKFARFLKILRLFRALKLKKIFGKLEDYLQLSLTFNAVLACVRLGFLMICIAHWFACIWHFIALYESDENYNTWLQVQGIQNEEWVIKYIYSVYWAITTMVTVGYGDITPSTPVEKIYAIFCMLLACGVFGYIMNRIGSIFSSFDENSFEYKLKLFQINQYMKKKNIPKSMQVKVRKYVNYTFDPDKKRQMDESAFFQCLSGNLQTELAEYMNHNVLKQFKLLSRILSKKILKKLATAFKEQIFSPEDVIIREKESFSTEKYLYFLYKGIACSYYEECNLQLQILNDGNSFGEIGFFTKMTRIASVKSLDFIYVYTLKRDDFLMIIEKERSKEDMEVFYEIKDKIELYSDYTCLDIECYSCGNSDHLISECPFIHYVIKPLEILKKNKKNEFLFNSKFSRNPKRKKFNALANTALVESSSYAILNVLLLYQEENLENCKNERAEIKIQEFLEENNEGVGISYSTFQKFKEEQNFDKLIKTKSSQELPSFLPLFGMGKTSSEPHIIVLNSPRNRKSHFRVPKTSKAAFSKMVQDFSEAVSMTESSSSHDIKSQKSQKSQKIINPLSNTSIQNKNLINVDNFHESFQIDKIESFTRYFPSYNFEEIQKKLNKNSKNCPGKKTTFEIVKEKEISVRINEKIDLLKKKTITTRRALKKSDFSARNREASDELLIEDKIDQKALEQFKSDKIENQNENELLEKKKSSGSSFSSVHVDFDQILSGLDLKKIEAWIHAKKKLL